MLAVAPSGCECGRVLGRFQRRAASHDGPFRLCVAVSGGGEWLDGRSLPADRGAYLANLALLGAPPSPSDSESASHQGLLGQVDSELAL